MSDDTTTMPRAINGEIHRHGEQLHTRMRLLRVDWPDVPVQVLIEPLRYRVEGFDEHAGHEERRQVSQAAADRIAEIIRDTVESVTEAEAKCDRLREANRRERRARIAAQSRLEHLLGQRRRLHGAIVVRPQREADFTGPVWLLGKGRDWSSTGFCYESLAELWRECPDYRPVAWGVDELGPWLEIAQLPMADGSAP